MPAKGSILPCFLLELPACYSFVLPLTAAPGPLSYLSQLTSSALTQSLVSLCLFPAKLFPLGLLPAGPDGRLSSKGKCLHTSSPFPFLAAAWCIPSSQPHSRHTSPGDGLGSISNRLEYLLLRLSPLQISCCCIPEKGTKSFRTRCSPSQCRRRHQLCIPA